MRRHPATDIAERDDVVAVIVHQWRHHEVRQPYRPARPEEEEAVVADRRPEGVALFLAPPRKQPVDADRIDDGAGKDMRADLGALFKHDDGKLRIELLQPDRGGKARRPRADDDHVEFHALTLDFFHPAPLPAARPTAAPNSLSSCITQFSPA
jgi:hypothetical protein